MSERPVDQLVMTKVTMQPALFAFVAAAAGTAVGFVAAVAVALPIIHNDLATATSQMNQKLTASSRVAAADLTPEELAVICGPQMQAQGQVLGAETVPGAQAGMPAGGAGGGQQPGQGGQGGQGGAGGNVFIKKLIGGAMVKTVSSINNTGPSSENNITNNVETTTNITNTNKIHTDITNDQQAVSGSANVSNNTNAGAATTGDASNANDTSVSVNVSNN